MGQLEKYGLYVLCLVIFLILGVTIWGSGDVPVHKTPSVAIHAPSGSTPGGAGTTPGNANVPGGGATRGLEAMFGPAEGGAEQGQNDPPRNQNPQAQAQPQAQPQQGAGTAPANGGGAAAPAPKKVIYKVQDGDTLDGIARAKLGKASLWPEIQKLNPDVKPDRLKPGQELVLPSSEALAAKTRKPALDQPLPIAADGTRMYLVKKGDNFERIAQNELGSARRTKEVLELNPDVEPTRLRLGMSIKLPKK